MLSTLLSVACALALHATPATSPAAPPDPGMEVPPGSPQDQALWRSANEVSERIITERAIAAALQQRAKITGYDAKLAALAKRQPPGDAAKTEALLKRFAAAWANSAQLLTQRWPVDLTRGCRYPVLNFESVLYQQESPAKQAALRGAREDVQACVDKAVPPVEATAKSNGEFRGAIEDVEKLLASAAAPGAEAPAGHTAAPAPAAPAAPAPVEARK